MYKGFLFHCQLKIQLKKITTIAAIISAIATTGLTLSIVQMPQAQGQSWCDINYPNAKEQFINGCDFGSADCHQHKQYDDGKSKTTPLFHQGYHEGWIKRGCK
jgi:hypothetical protein